MIGAFQLSILEEAVKQNKIEYIKLFLDTGLSVNAKVNSNDTLLMAAIRHGHIELVKMLLKRGASLANEADGKPDDKAFQALKFLRHKDDNAFHLALRLNRTDILKEILDFISEYAYKPESVFSQTVLSKPCISPSLYISQLDTAKESFLSIALSNSDWEKARLLFAYNLTRGVSSISSEALGNALANAPYDIIISLMKKDVDINKADLGCPIWLQLFNRKNKAERNDLLLSLIAKRKIELKNTDYNFALVLTDNDLLSQLILLIRKINCLSSNLPSIRSFLRSQREKINLTLEKLCADPASINDAMIEKAIADFQQLLDECEDKKLEWDDIDKFLQKFPLPKKPTEADNDSSLKKIAIKKVHAALNNTDAREKLSPQFEEDVIVVYCLIYLKKESMRLSDTHYKYYQIWSSLIDQAYQYFIDQPSSIKMLRFLLTQLSQLIQESKSDQTAVSFSSYAIEIFNEVKVKFEDITQLASIRKSALSPVSLPPSINDARKTATENLANEIQSSYTLDSDYYRVVLEEVKNESNRIKRIDNLLKRHQKLIESKIPDDLIVDIRLAYEGKLSYFNLEQELETFNHAQTIASTLSTIEYRGNNQYILDQQERLKELIDQCHTLTIRNNEPKSQSYLHGKLKQFGMDIQKFSAQEKLDKIQQELKAIYIDALKKDNKDRSFFSKFNRNNQDNKFFQQLQHTWPVISEPKKSNPVVMQLNKLIKEISNLKKSNGENEEDALSTRDKMIDLLNEKIQAAEKSYGSSDPKHCAQSVNEVTLLLDHFKKIDAYFLNNFETMKKDIHVNFVGLYHKIYMTAYIGLLSPLQLKKTLELFYKLNKIVIAFNQFLNSEEYTKYQPYFKADSHFLSTANRGRYQIEEIFTKWANDQCKVFQHFIENPTDVEAVVTRIKDLQVALNTMDQREKSLHSFFAGFYTQKKPLTSQQDSIKIRGAIQGLQKDIETTLSTSYELCRQP